MLLHYCNSLSRSLNLAVQMKDDDSKADLPTSVGILEIASPVVLESVNRTQITQ